MDELLGPTPTYQGGDIDEHLTTEPRGNSVNDVEASNPGQHMGPISLQ